MVYILSSFIFVFSVIIVITVEIGIAGAILALFGGLLFIFNSSNNKKYLLKVKATQTFKIKDIITICNIVKEEMKTSGYFKMMVAVQGTIKDNDFQIYNKEYDIYKERDRVKDDQFYIEDNTGQILVKINEIEVFLNYNGNPLFKENKPSSHVTTVKNIEGSIYIIGEASDVSGVLTIKNSIIFLITKKQCIQQLKNESVSCIMLFGILLIIFGILAIIYLIFS